MRKQMKIAAVVSATALLAIGASFASMAASKTGTWAQDGDNWYCYDKEGDAYEAEFCTFEGKDYYVGDDGIMLTNSWVDYDGAMYYVGETGAKTTNAWMDLIPHNDEDAEEERYWFKSSGKMAKNEKIVIDGKTYYFGNEGQMLTGWVDTAAFDEATSTTNAVYCDEEGARLAKTWVETTVPGADEDETDEFWYYIGSKGAVTTGKAKSISGNTYLFNGEGQMLSGWVANIATSGNAVYDEVGGEGSTFALAAGKEVYFCGDSDDGHVKKDQWIKEWKPSQFFAEDADKDQYWYYIGKDGQVFVPTTTTTANAMKFFDAEDKEIKVNGDAYQAAIKEIDDKYYVFNAAGEMKSGLIRISGGVNYFGGADDGARKTGSFVIADEYGVEGKFLFSTATADKYVGVTGPKSGKLYKDGLLITATDYKYAVEEVAGNNYIVNGSGSIQTTQKIYKDGDVEITNAETATFSAGKAGEAPKGAVTGLK